jgi:beta-glucanase (GH16 family)
MGQSGRRTAAAIRWLAFALVPAAVLLLAASTAAAQTLVFDDEFNGHTVSVPWTINVGQGYATGQCWVNDHKHVSEGGGYLSLTATYVSSGNPCGDGNYGSGSINVPASTWSYLYGTAEARLKVPCQSGTGVWPSFWQYASQNPSNDNNGEIDTMELLDNTSATGAATIGSPRPNPGAGQYVSQSIHGQGLNPPYDLATSTVYNPYPEPDSRSWCGAFHIFGNTWTPNSVSFTVDGVTEQTFNSSQFPAWPLVTAQAPVLSLLVGQYGGTPNPATFPQTMLVDWIRIWH